VAFLKKTAMDEFRFFYSVEVPEMTVPNPAPYLSEKRSVAWWPVIDFNLRSE
jgi:hypothetical protein